jgi:hypothetical protein
VLPNSWHWEEAHKASQNLAVVVDAWASFEDSAEDNLDQVHPLDTRHHLAASFDVVELDLSSYF